MLVDFGTILRIFRSDLEALLRRRSCRLGSEAYEHFRETLAQYLRRYPVDAWYPLDAAEFAQYKKSNQGAEPRPWQVDTESAF